MYTLGYAFKPWLDHKAIADGGTIRKYIQETADENGITQHIHHGHQVTEASWSSEHAHWTITATVKGSSEPIVVKAKFLYLCCGYYSYQKAYQPDFPGQANFKGQWVHPQFWPEKLNYAQKKVVVIGSGATAVTLVPEMAKTASHVTMLQRTPTYVVSRPGSDGVSLWLQKFLPENLAYQLTRFKNVSLEGQNILILQGKTLSQIPVNGHRQGVVGLQYKAGRILDLNLIAFVCPSFSPLMHHRQSPQEGNQTFPAPISIQGSDSCGIRILIKLIADAEIQKTVQGGHKRCGSGKIS
jgi:cation diffusion facilitator CzcD-associated flavoprotein CzcO